MSVCAEPEPVDDSKPSRPYREPPPPCAVCTARAAALAPMLPFTTNRIECTVCGNDVGSMPTVHNEPKFEKIHQPIAQSAWWTNLCVGQGVTLISARIPSWWKFWAKRRPAETLACPLNKFKGDAPPPHFHIRCGRCKTLLAMATKNA